MRNEIKEVRISEGEKYLIKQSLTLLGMPQKINARLKKNPSNTGRGHRNAFKEIQLVAEKYHTDERK